MRRRLNERENNMQKRFGIFAAALLMFANAFAAHISDGGFETNAFLDGVRVGNPIYTVNDEFVSGGIDKGDIIESELCVIYDGGAEQSFTALTAVYDENDTMRALSYDTKKTSGGELLLKSSVSAPEAFSDGKYTIRTFLWDDVNLNFIYTDVFGCGKNLERYVNTAWNMEGGFSSSSEKAFEGLSSLKLKNNGGDSICTQNAYVDGGKILKLSFAATGDAEFDYDIKDKDGNPLTEAECAFLGSDGWTFANKAVIAPEEDCEVVISFKNRKSGNVSYIDNVEISENLVSNGGFEYGEMGFLCLGTHSVSDDAKSGENSLCLDNGMVKQRIFLIGGKVYNFSADIKGSNSYLKVTDDQNGCIAFVKSASSSLFKAKGMDFYVENSGMYDVCLITEGKAYFDNLSLTKASDDIIVNGSFEDGTSSWDMRGTTAAVLKVTEGANGKNGLMLSNRTQNYYGIKQQVAKNIANYGVGKYKISGYVKYADPGAEPGSVAVKFNGLYSDKKKIFSENITGVGGFEWKYFEIIFDIDNFGTDDGGNTLYECPTGKNDGVLYFETLKGDTQSFIISDIKMEALGGRIVNPEYGEYDGPADPAE